MGYQRRNRYPRSQEIRKNNYYNSGLQTGCGAETPETTSQSTTCTLAYGSGINEYPQSTTGNITGVFDMSGGAYEYVIGNYNNTAGSSGFTTFPESKYYDVYTTLAACTTETCGGHALNETYEWYRDKDYFVNFNVPWFLRGGYYEDGVYAGAFSFSRTYGHDYTQFSWRSVLSIQ